MNMQRPVQTVPLTSPAGGILTINGGSSSIKFALFQAGPPPRRILSGLVERIGLADGLLRVKQTECAQPLERPIDASDHASAVGQIIHWLEEHECLASLSAIGHRVVHGGERYVQATRIDDEVVTQLRRLSRLDPAHLPGEIAIIEAFSRRLPAVPQFACFDTAFHHDMPRVAKLLPIPLRYAMAGVRRFGFHGLSYAWLLEELARLAGQETAQGRVVFAHLGSGCSLAAVLDGKCVDTTMGFTPTAGLVMGRRSGDLDPGLLIHLLREEQLSVDQLEGLLNSQSGLLGLSETSSDVRDLLAREHSDARAADAVAVFCYQARKWIGAYAAALGGLDALVFSAGIGENSPVIRSRICAGLEFLDLDLDEQRNAANSHLISADGSRVAVYVIRTDEESMIARDVLRLVTSGKMNACPPASPKPL